MCTTSNCNGILSREIILIYDNKYNQNETYATKIMKSRNDYYKCEKNVKFLVKKISTSSSSSLETIELILEEEILCELWEKIENLMIREVCHWQENVTFLDDISNNSSDFWNKISRKSLQPERESMGVNRIVNWTLWPIETIWLNVTKGKKRIEFYRIENNQNMECIRKIFY
jgi:hypothetical protein